MIRSFLFTVGLLGASCTCMADAALEGKWTGQWSSKSTNASGELELQITKAEGAAFPAKVRQTRPDNGNWRCSEKLDDIEVRRSADAFTFDYSPGGRCSKAAHRFQLQDGRIVGTYKAGSGAESEYVLRKQ
jgi:hypothetical protein